MIKDYVLQNSQKKNKVIVWYEITEGPGRKQLSKRKLNTEGGEENYKENLPSLM